MKIYGNEYSETLKMKNPYCADFPPNEVFDILRSRGITQLHHSNSVHTSCHFLKEGALISRGSMEERGLSQTTQRSDEIDKKELIWNDVFTDSVDIHKRGSKLNLYGPVLFVINIERLAQKSIGYIRVTKTNPQYWEGKTDSEKWFISLQELMRGFIIGAFSQMIVFRNENGELPLAGCLDEIILDNPKLTLPDTNVDVFSMAYGALKCSMFLGGISVNIRERSCAKTCNCINDYHQYYMKGGDKYIRNKFLAGVLKNKTTLPAI